jgi:hypothetical protein
MGFDLGSTVNAAADWLCSAPIVRSVINNPIFTALLVTALAAIVILALYNHRLKGTGFKRGARAFIYVFLVVTAVLFVHHYAVMRCARREATQKGVRDVFSGIQQSRQSGMPSIPVMSTGYYADAADSIEGTSGESGGFPAEAFAPVRSPAQTPVTGGHVLRPDNIAPDAGLVIEDVVLPRPRPLAPPRH